MRNKLGLRTLPLIVILAALLAGRCAADEFRGVWADAWPSHPGFHNATETTDMVNKAAVGHFNAIAMNASNAGFAYFYPTAPDLEPRGSGYVSPSSYDPLADVIIKAHAQGIKVHAWIVCNDIAPKHYTDPSHVMNAHPDWLTKDSSGNTTNTDQPDYWLDPGVPDAMTWNYNLCMDVVANYDIDGLHFDFVRYPGPNSGYNAIALARFNDEYGRTGQPSTTDTDFSNWRRRQVTDFVKKVYANAVAIKPNLVISAATFGSRSSAISSKFQDWDTWMSKGYLDANVPMIYYGPSGNGSFQTYMADDHAHSHGRHTYIGQGAGSNPISNTITQIGYVRSEGCEGVMCYSYAGTNNESASTSTFFSTLGSSTFPTVVNAPAMSWKTNPTEGILKGTVTGQGGAAVYNATITVSGQTDLSDGTGFYALTKLPPATYNATCVASGYISANAEVSIAAGAVTTRDFALTPDGTPPAISNIAVTSIYSTLATITWTTDEKATSQVEYGLTPSYGSQTAVNTAKLTSHSFSLSGLTPSTLYHYRVKSIDGTNNLGASTDQTFMTDWPCGVSDIIIDNDNANNSGGSLASSSGSWTVAYNLSQKWATSYGYTRHVSPPDTAWFKWTPNIIVPNAYMVYVWYPSDSPNAHTHTAPYTVYYNGGSQTFSVNQHINTGAWNLLGSFNFLAGTSGYVKVGNGTSSSETWVMADATKFVYDCDTVPPTINSVSVTPPLVSGGAPINVSVSATDNVGIAGVKACEIDLALSGPNTYSGSVPTDPALGRHTVNVVVKDLTGNQTTSTAASYLTARVFGLTNSSLLSGGATQAGAGQYLFKTWGYASVQDPSYLSVSDGSLIPLKVYCPGHGLTTSRFVIVTGIWNYSTTPPQLECQPEQIR